MIPAMPFCSQVARIASSSPGERSGAIFTRTGFRGLPATLPVFQWHGDTFAIPPDGVLLATGTDCVNQALRHANSWGLQFHVEADRPLLASWFAGTPHEREILARCDELLPATSEIARTLFENFLGFARRPR